MLLLTLRLLLALLDLFQSVLKQRSVLFIVISVHTRALFLSH